MSVPTQIANIKLNKFCSLHFLPSLKTKIAMSKLIENEKIYLKLVQLPRQAKHKIFPGAGYNQFINPIGEGW